MFEVWMSIVVLIKLLFELIGDLKLVRCCVRWLLLLLRRWMSLDWDKFFVSYLMKIVMSLVGWVMFEWSDLKNVVDMLLSLGWRCRLLILSRFLGVNELLFIILLSSVLIFVNWWKCLYLSFKFVLRCDRLVFVMKWSCLWIMEIVENWFVVICI